MREQRVRDWRALRGYPEPTVESATAPPARAERRLPNRGGGQEWMKQNSAPAGTVDGLRKKPQQARSRARVDAIFAAATDILAADGVEGLTMRRLAAQAGVPSGTLYQFFEDKPAVLAAVTRHHMGAFATAMDELIDRAGQAPWPELIDIVFDNYVQLYRENPGYLAIRAGRRLTPELLRLDDANNDLVADGIRRILVAQKVLPDGPDVAVAARAGVHAADAVLQLAFRSAPNGDPRLLAQAKRIVHAYLRDLAV
ncbi:TetR/AcrR family transcriptional regulator [Embleya scabrispora]|uniref:TetR/AcrR family transcriptional regulator n=1 Tax=Embleya scabrispora TaxID=159449 RepID=UPI00037922D8|nr:TetR/AcrR family transcriptional regulator [Embleya scabrispora]MYS87652.1 TetR family transcriptional regulator [Streptomyces sp. SID5474]